MEKLFSPVIWLRIVALQQHRRKMFIQVMESQRTRQRSSTGAVAIPTVDLTSRVRALTGFSPVYPDALRAVDVEGEVLAHSLSLKTGAHFPQASR
jgi:hypothetical protein